MALFRIRTIGMVACILGLSVPPAVSAEEGNDSPAAASPEDGLVDVVVTAQRRKEREQEVPIAITTLGPEQIERQGIKTGFELTKTVPGLVYGSNSAYAVPFLRGVGSVNDSPGDEPAVATYIDGVYIGNGIVLSLPYGSVQGVEVLKGPQGTLFGRNAVGGVINVTLRGPERHFNTTASIGYDNFQAVEGSLFVTGPLSDKLSASADVQFRQQDRGFYRNDYDGSRADRQDYATFRGKLRIDATDDLSFDISADYQNTLTGQGGVAGELPGTVPLAALAGGTYPTAANHVYSNVSGNNRVSTYGASIIGTLDLHSVLLKSITSYRHLDYKFFIQNGFFPDGVLSADQPNPGLIDPQGVPVGTRSVIPASTYYVNRTTNPYFATQEIQIASASGSPLEWILGGFAQWSSDRWETLQVNYQANPAVPFVEFRDTPQLTRTYAAFGQATYHLTQQLALVGGLRYSTETKSTHGTQYVFGDQVAVNSQEESFNGVSYRGGINYQMTDKTLLYASASRGFKSGVFVVSNFGGDAVKPERLDAYEVGIKTDITSRLRVNADVYHYNYKDMQVSAIALGGLTALANAAQARMNGAELELQAIPLTGLTISLSGSYEDAYYQSFPNAQAFLRSNSAGYYQVTADVSGKQLIRTPKWSGTTGVTYVRGLADLGSLTLGANYYRSGAFPWDYTGTLRQGGYGTLDLSADWKTANERYSVMLYGTNVSNAKYAAGVQPGVQGALAFWGKPAVVGVRLRYNFN
jgi:iron complex outermembrane recepter protein